MLAYEDVFDRTRIALRKGERDTWVGSSPSREELEEMLGGDEEMIAIVFEESIAEMLDRYVSDQRLKDALCGQGIIGACAGPRDPGTASIQLMHFQGDLEGQAADLGLRRGRHGARLVRDRPGRSGRRGVAGDGRPGGHGSCPARGWSWRAAN